MSEKRGYPNPNYTDEDVMAEPVEVKEEITIDETVVISPDKFERLCAKAAALDILTAAVSRKGEVNADIVWAVTGASADTVVQNLKKDAAQKLDWYWNEKQKVEKLEARVAQLESTKLSLLKLLLKHNIEPSEESTEEPKAEGES